jgi:peptide/nickel transport system substrate-binding protein
MHKRQRVHVSARLWAYGAVAALAAGAGLAACGSDDDDGQSVSSETVASSDASDTTSGETTTPSGSNTTDAPETTTPSGSNTTDAPETTLGGDEPVAGGSLTYLNIVDTEGFDPALSNAPGSQNGMMNYALFDVLAHESPSTGEVVFGLLESADSTDGATWTLKLKPGLEFTDGTPLDAEAVKSNWERLADPATGALSMEAAQSVTSITVVDDTTLDVVLAEPNGQFLRTIATTALTWIASPTALQADAAGFNMQPVGAGPYMLEEAVPGSAYVFTRNPNYHGTTYVDEFTVKVIPDETQRLAALQSGEGDVALTPSAITANQAIDAGFDSFSSSSSGGYVMFFNTKRAPFDNLKVRQAFALAMDSQEVSDTLYDGNRTVANNMFVETSAFYDARFDQPEPDAAAAQKLFDEIAAERGGPLEVTLSYIVVLASEAEWFQAKMASFDNVTVNLEQVPPTEYLDKWSKGEFEFGVHAYLFVDPIDLAKYAGTGGLANFSQFSDPEVDAAFAEGAAALDEQERIDSYATVQQKIVDEVPFSFILRPEAYEMFDADEVHGIGPESRVSAGGMLKVSEVWVTD